jgi:hypothetical protein
MGPGALSLDYAVRLEIAGGQPQETFVVLDVEDRAQSLQRFHETCIPLTSSGGP